MVHAMCDYICGLYSVILQTIFRFVFVQPSLKHILLTDKIMLSPALAKPTNVLLQKYSNLNELL